MTEGRYKQPRLLSLLAYFSGALTIYLESRNIFTTPLGVSTWSGMKVFWILVVSSLVFSCVSESALLIKYKKSFSTLTREEVTVSDLVKTLVNLLVALAYSYVVYSFVTSRNPDLKNPLAFFAVAGMVYIGTAAICKYVRYIPVLVIFFKEKS